MDSTPSRTQGSRTERWLALALCAAVAATWALKQFVLNRSTYAGIFATNWVPLAAAVLAAAGTVPSSGRRQWPRLQRALHWGGLFMMVWAASGLPLDLLRLVPGLMPPGIDWPGLVTRAFALAAVVVLARLALARPATPASARAATWYGWAAFVLALPYPVVRTCWALGGTVGLDSAGSGGHGWLPWLACIPWLLAAALAVLLVSTPRWMPRRLLLLAGWTATAMVAMIGPAACLALVRAVVNDIPGPEGIALWVVALFYGSWALWAIAAGAATRAYQLRSASAADGLANASVLAIPASRRSPYS